MYRMSAKAGVVWITSSLVLSMRYFVAFTDVDPPYVNTDPACAVMISPTCISPFFRFTWGRPAEVLIDSGAYHHNRRRRALSQEEAVEQQMRILGALPEASRVGVMHCDVLPRQGISPAQALEATLVNAEKFLSYPLPGKVERVAVAHGDNPEEMYAVIRYLRELGYSRIAVGGLSRLNFQHRPKLLRLLEAAGEAGQDAELHALGLSGATLLPLMSQCGFASCDSAAPALFAVHGSLIYSHPFRRYRLDNALLNRADARQRTSLYEPLASPLPCPCPVCSTDPELLSTPGVEGTWYRSIHNYLHLKAQVEGRQVWERPYSLDGSRYGLSS